MKNKVQGEGMFKTLKSIPLHRYSQKLSASVVYAILSSIALNFFFQPAHLYSSGATGLAQILTTLTTMAHHTIPVSITLYAINIPLFILAWKGIGHRFTIFTVITVTLASLTIHIMPEFVMTKDPIVCAIFGGAINGVGIGYALRSGLSSGGADIVSLFVQKKTGHPVGRISFIFNGCIVLIAGALFGWQYALYTIMTIFVSSRVTDAIFTKQKKVQIMIVTRDPEKVIAHVQYRMRRGITIINDAEGAYNHQKQTVLLTVINRMEIGEFRRAMLEADSHAFVSMSDNVHILGNFYEDPL
jgi:uncharacterized membrane-anchored protein YitT (DUF2179 family)